MGKSWVTNKIKREYGPNEVSTASVQIIYILNKRLVDTNKAGLLQKKYLQKSNMKRHISKGLLNLH
jgi:hypothetical protein